MTPRDARGKHGWINTSLVELHRNKLSVTSSLTTVSEGEASSYKAIL